MKINSKEYWDKKGGSQQTQRFAQIVIKNIHFLPTRPLTILDVGCASGEMLNMLSFYFPFSKVYGCDFSQAAIHKAKEKYPNLKENFFVADIFSLSKIRKKFDLVICLNVLGHLENPEKALNEIIKVSKRYVIILVPAEQKPFGEHIFSFNESFFTTRNFSVHKDFTTHFNIDGIQFVCILDKKAQNLILTETPKILIGSPIRQEPEILKEFLSSLSALDTSGLSCDYLFIDNNENKLSKNLLRDFAKQHPTLIWEQPPLGNYTKHDFHEWDNLVIQRVAEFKNKIINYAIKEKYDFLFLTDSDLILHPFTLKHLLSKKKDIISTIFWTKWEKQICPLPQVWFSGQYDIFKKIKGEKIDRNSKIARTNYGLTVLTTPGTYEVGGLGACTLISRQALKKGINFEEIYNLPYIGEDRHFCIRAVAMGFQLFVDTSYPAFHIYRKNDLSKVETYKQYCKESIQNGTVLDSIKIIKMLEEEMNTNPKFYYEEGERLYKEGKIEEATIAFKKALELDPFLDLAHNNLAFIYWQKQDVEKALHHIIKAMEISPDNRDIIWNCGQIMLGLGYAKDAYEVYKSYLKRHPEEKEIRQVVEELEKGQIF